MRLYRSMTEDHDGLPAVGPGGRLLGVRPGNAPVADVPAVDAADQVLPGQGGMSVAPDDPLHLLRHRRPRSLGGTGFDPVWYIETNDLGPDLSFQQNHPGHGVIEPTTVVTLGEFQQALARTRLSWKLYCR